MVYSLDGLGHDSVVSRNYEDRDIGRLCASRSHRGKRLVSGGVEEGKLSVADLYSVSTDVLCDTACLSGGYVRVSYSIEERGLAVVNVTHYADNGCAVNQLILGVLGLVEELFFDGYNDLRGRGRLPTAYGLNRYRGG